MYLKCSVEVSYKISLFNHCIVMLFSIHLASFFKLGLCKCFPGKGVLSFSTRNLPTVVMNNTFSLGTISSDILLPISLNILLDFLCFSIQYKASPAIKHCIITPYYRTIFLCMTEYLMPFILGIILFILIEITP